MHAIETRSLSKSYGCLLAVDALDLSVAQGSFFGLLGRNGSGKTTTLHMLSTLVRPSAGQAWVGGYEVVRQPVAVRRAIGVVFQESALDRTLTVVENLRFAAALAGLSPRIARQRGEELLKLFDLTEKRHAPVS
ncbi:MAG: ATP-binding cassette domain-containing protein, partial [Gammaproteobacteria bacterium]